MIKVQVNLTSDENYLQAELEIESTPVYSVSVGPWFKRFWLSRVRQHLSNFLIVPQKTLTHRQWKRALSAL